MDGRQPVHRCYRFGRFVLDVNRLQLREGDRLVPLSPKAFEILALLVERRGELLTKEHLLSAVWPGTAVEENNLARHVSTLRRLLGDTRETHEYIATIPGRGYQFVASAELAQCADESVDSRGAVSHDAPIGTSSSEQTIALEMAGVAAGPYSHDAVSRPAGLRRWVPAAVAGALLPAVAAVFAWQLTGEVAIGDAAAAGLHRLTYGASLQHQPAWSPDGRRVVFASEVSGNSDLWVQDLDKALPVQLTTEDGHEWQPAWSPDGRWIAFRSEGTESGLFVISSSGGARRQLTTFGYGPRWSPSGDRLLFSGSSLDDGKAVPWVVRLDGAGPERVRPDVMRGFSTAHVAWRPREDALSVWGRARNAEHVFLTMTVEADSEPSVWDIPPVVRDSLDELGLSLGAFSWAPAGDALYFEGTTQDASNVWRIRVDPVSKTWRDAPARLTVGSANRDFAVSPDGRRLAFSSVMERTRLWSFGLDQRGGVDEGIPLTSGAAGEFDAAAPRDGRRLAYRTHRGGRQQLWARATPDGADRILLASNDWRGTSPRWSPDGRTVAYSRRGLRTGIGLVDTETGRERFLTLPPDLNMDIVPDDWSSDGSMILAACRRAPGEGYSICLVTIDESSVIDEVRVIAAAPPGRALICARFSPDQRWISFMVLDRQQPSVSTLYVMPAEGGPWVPITSGTSYDDKPRWSADGQMLYYISDRAGLMNLYGQPIDLDRGMPMGGAARLTAFDRPSRAMTAPLGRVEIAVSEDQVFLPLTDASGDIWVLDLP